MAVVNRFSGCSSNPTRGAESHARLRRDWQVGSVSICASSWMAEWDAMCRNWRQGSHLNPPTMYNRKQAHRRIVMENVSNAKIQRQRAHGSRLLITNRRTAHMLAMFDPWNKVRVAEVAVHGQLASRWVLFYRDPTSERNSY
jgi:hypothetical protein